MKIIFIRHGESEANVACVINDDPARGVNLTGRGREQAQAVAQELRELRFTHAYVSEFPRAQQTAAILLREHDCALQVDARLNERRTGMDGLPVHVFNDLVQPDLLHIKPEHGESFVEEMERVRGFLDDIAARHPQGLVLAVSHENPILAALALTLREPAQIAQHDGIANCGRVEFDWPP